MLVVLRWPVGGIRTYVRYNYPFLQEEGYRFTFLGPADGDFRAFAAELRGWEGAEFAEAPVRRKRCRLWLTARVQLRTGRFALVHSHGLIATAQAAAANLALGVPHVATIHDVFRPVHAAGWRGRFKVWALGRLLRRVDAVAAVGEDVRANLAAHVPGLEKDKRLVSIRNGIDTERFAEASGVEAEPLRSRLALGNDVCLMGFLGRFMEQKGFLPLLDALSRLADRPTRPWHLVAVGSGDYEREYRQEAQRRGLSAKVTFLGFMPDVRPVLRQLDLLLMPSLWEACPLLPMEALAAGVPVLGSDCIGLREVLRDTPSLMAPAGDVDAWCNALERAVARPWAEAARDFAPEARRRFSVAPAAEQLRQVFDGVLAGRRTARGRVRTADPAVPVGSGT